MNFVIDTNIIIDYLRGGMMWDVFLAKVDRTSELYLPTMFVFELFSGKSSKDHSVTRKIQNLRKFFHEVPLSYEIAKNGGEIYRDSPASFELQDYIIAATALELNAEVVTLNRKHFEKIYGIRVFEF